MTPMKNTLLSVVALVCAAEVGVHLVRRLRHEPSMTPAQAQVASANTSANRERKVEQKHVARDATTQALSPDRASIDRSVLDRSALLESLEKAPSESQGDDENGETATAKANSNTNLSRNPFVPLSYNGKRQLDDLSPLTSTELSDMRLAAVIKDSAGDYSASVETKQGRNLIVKRGAHIGTRGGQVVQITSSRVIISELIQDQLGKKSVRFRELAMRAPPPTSGLTSR